MNKLEINNLGDDRAEVLLYGDIGGWGHTASSVKDQLDGVTASEITLRIHSYGGDALEGIAIKNVLRSHSARVVGIVDGVAASAASLIAVAGSDELIMGKNSEMMIHDGWIFADGDAATLRKMADRLDQVSENYASAYAEKAGGDPADWRDLMMAETWFSAEEAVQIGLADRVASADSAEVAALAGSRVFASFKYSGRRASPAPKMAPLGQKEGTTMDFMASIAQRLGIERTDDEATVLAALDETLAEQVDTELVETPEGTTSEDDEPQEVEAADGTTDGEDSEDGVDTGGDEPAESTAETVVVDKDVFEQLQREAEIGRRAEGDQLHRQAEELVAAAIKDGKVLAAKRDALVSATVADFDGMKAHFAQLAPGLIPVSEKGRGGSDEARGVFAKDDHAEKNKLANTSMLFGAPTI